MLFSTKAEYGVRLMVELGRRTDGDSPEEATPVSLTAVAEAENLPLSYLEHLVAKLRQAGLVTSVRGAHGGYRLARDASEIAMLDVVQALEGPDRADGVLPHRARGPRPLLARGGPDPCATKLLWTRVHGGVTKALAGTTLAELVKFSEGQPATLTVA